MKYSFWIYVFYIFECVRSEERNYRIVVQKITTSNVDNDIFEKVDVELFQINNRSYLDGSVVFKQPGSDMMVNSVLDFWRPNKQHMRVFDVRFSLCSFFEESHKNKFFNNYSKAIKKFATKEFKCPFEANVTYGVKKLYFDERDFPTFVPLGKFRSKFEYYLNEDVWATFSAQGQIISWN
ncbi:uncharacterized protein LOC6502445 [Drosophila ananassae]|nr:uncharacterized protein LOC6502445 [Drosophila ananassae]